MARKRQPVERHVLVLQGGGALGSYQAGVFEALSDASIAPDWVAGVSIGAINAALIAGNPPERRVARLREFWRLVTSCSLAPSLAPGDEGRSVFNEASAAWTTAIGAPGFFSPRLPPVVFQPKGAPGALSVYDTGPLLDTLERLVDFKRINEGDMRFSVGAVNVETGNFAYFDNRRDGTGGDVIGPEHVMASGALPPGFPPVKIGDEYYWDGGLVSNTPLNYVLDAEPDDDHLIFQVDLFSARGLMPLDLSGVVEREKDIRYSSRTRMNTTDRMRIEAAREALQRLAEKLGPDYAADPDLAALQEFARKRAVTIVQVIYRDKAYERGAKDYEFSRQSMHERWAAGVDDVRCTLSHPRWRERARPDHGAASLDFTRDKDPARQRGGTPVVEKS